MHTLLLVSLFISPLIPLTHATLWTTTIIFHTYLQPLERNPVGIPALRNYYNPRDPTNLNIALVSEPYEIRYPNGDYESGTRELEYQIYPGQAPLPGLGPSRNHAGQYLLTGSCTNVPPGYCCRPFRPFVTNGYFVGLPSGTIAGFWGPPANDDGALHQGCYDEVLASYAGPNPRWGWQDPAFPPRISGASYIQCPGPNIAGGWGAILAGFCRRLNRRMSGKRDASAGVKEEVPSNRSGWPDVIVFNGTTYTDDHRGDLVYRDAAGGWLNFRPS